MYFPGQQQQQRSFSTSTCLRFSEIVYKNVDKEKLKILKENINKSGIYMWKNLTNDKRYIGSSNNLKIRFSRYFNVNQLKRCNFMYICRALLKHGYSNFSLTIIEYCEVSELLTKEKYWVKLFNPEYNIIQDPTAPPMSGRKHSDKSKTKISDAQKGNTSGFKKGNQDSKDQEDPLKFSSNRSY